MCSRRLPFSTSIYILVLRLSLWTASLLSFAHSLSHHQSVIAPPILHTQVWTRRIQTQPNNVTNALEVLAELSSLPPAVATSTDLDKPILEALRVFGANQRPDLAIETYRKFSHSETCRTMTISVLGACQKAEEALKLLEDENANIGSYNAAIAACGKAKDWERALQVYHQTVERGICTTLTCNALLTILAQRRQGTVALEIFSNMPCVPDRLTFQFLISALVRAGLKEDAFQILERLESRPEDNIKINDAVFDMLVAAFTKESNWERAAQVEQFRNPDFDPSTFPSGDRPLFQHWTGLVKVGRGKESYWEIAHIHIPDSCSIVIGVHPNRNPSKNGIQLEFYERDNQNHRPDQRRKLGYVLIQSKDRYSRLLGMYLQGSQRGKGISKVCLAFWFWMCFQAKATPTTGVINKPLLALLLEEKFGMYPSGKGGVEMEMLPDQDNSGKVLLYAPSRKNLGGFFSPWDLQHQNIRLTQHEPATRGRRITVGTTFDIDVDRLPTMKSIVDEILSSAGSLSSRLETSADFQKVIFGRELD